MCLNIFDLIKMSCQSTFENVAHESEDQFSDLSSNLANVKLDTPASTLDSGIVTLNPPDFSSSSDSASYSSSSSSDSKDNINLPAVENSIHQTNIHAETNSVDSLHSNIESVDDPDCTFKQSTACASSHRVKKKDVEVTSTTGLILERRPRFVVHEDVSISALRL